MKQHVADLAVALQSEIDSSLAADTSLPGIAVTVEAPRRGLSWHGACGCAARGGNEVLSVQHAFRIASVTKVFVAAAALRLMEQERLSPFTPVASLLGDATCTALTAGSHDPKVITLYQLLTHTSGLPDHASAAAYREAVLQAPSHRWTRDEQIAFAMSLGAPVASPGARFSYSDTGYLLVGEIIERATGFPLPAVIRQQLAFEQLRLTQTHFESLEPTPAGQRRALQWLGNVDVAGIDPSVDLFGGGGIVSTTAEIARFLRALLRGELFERPETLAAGLMTPTVDFAPGDALHSILLRGGSLCGQACWLHGGFWGVVAAYFPASDITLALAFNQVDCHPCTRGSPGQPGLADRLTAIVHSAH